MAINRVSTSLRFPFACLANKRRKVAITPGYVNYPDLSPSLAFVVDYFRFAMTRVQFPHTDDPMKVQAQGIGSDYSGRPSRRIRSAYRGSERSGSSAG